jgi:Tol biopolymer transport system component
MDTTDPYQVFIRYLDSPTPAQVTHIPEAALPMAWAPDGKRILFESERAPTGIWSVSSVGGEPEPFMPLSEGFAATVSPDLQAVAFLASGEDGLYGVWISSPPGAPRHKYLPDPVASKSLFNGTRLHFSPDGKQLLLFLKNDKSRDEAWVMPYPPNPAKPPKLVFPGLYSFNGTPSFSWMPDSRHIVLSYQPVNGAPAQLWLADTATGERLALTSGTTARNSAAVSPDGRKIVFSEPAGNYHVVSVDLEHATVHRLLATEISESMPAWAAKREFLAYVTFRNGPMEIWLHGPDGTERPLVTARDFPPDTTQWFIAPALSPEGDRVIYERTDRQGHSQLWMSAVSGGAPVPVTNVVAVEVAGSWSPDGAWFAYLAFRNGKQDLLKVKTTGQATPILVKSGVASDIPSWSPAGDSVLCGNELLSPDGAVVRSLGDNHTPNYVFSQDGKLLYGLRGEGAGELLFSVDVATGAQKVIGDVGKDFAPKNDFHPGIRFSLAPDGKSFVYAAGRIKSNLWLMEGWTTGGRGWGIGGR